MFTRQPTDEYQMTNLLGMISTEPPDKVPQIWGLTSYYTFISFPYIFTAILLSSSRETEPAKLIDCEHLNEFPINAAKP